ncbi:radial spokehead-like protein, partial [Kipferlia bialata]
GLGLGIAEPEIVPIVSGVRAFSASHPSLRHVAFWGKVKCRTGFYHVVRAVPKLDLDETDPKKGQLGDTEYWVSSKGPFGPWSRLPDCTPRQIQMSRYVPCPLTGDLSCMPWLRVPPFPYTEAVLLSCRIKRITHACSIAPAGLYEVKEPEEEEEDAGPAEPVLGRVEEFEGAEVESLLTPEGWQHTLPVITVAGETLVIEKEEPEEEEEEEEEEFDEDADPVEVEMAQRRAYAKK